MLRLFLVVLLFLSGCTTSHEPEQMIYLHDSHERQYFLKLLKSEGVKHRANEIGQVWYYVKDKAAIDKVRSRVNERYLAGCGFMLNSQERYNELETELNARKIPFWVVEKDDGKWFVCEPKYSEEARKVFHNVMFSN